MRSRQAPRVARPLLEAGAVHRGVPRCRVPGMHLHPHPLVLRFRGSIPRLPQLAGQRALRFLRLFQPGEQGTSLLVLLLHLLRQNIQLPPHLLLLLAPNSTAVPPHPLQPRALCCQLLPVALQFPSMRGGVGGGMWLIFKQRGA